MYPVLSYYGKRIGYVQRQYKELNDWWSGGKALNIIEDTSVPWAHFPAGMDVTDTLYVVEDIPSAEAMAAVGVPTCALMGTNIVLGNIKMFIDIGIKNLCICLDNDALATAVNLKQKLELTFDSISVIFLQKDPKDMTSPELVSTFLEE